MIDEILDQQFENHLRVTLDEMISKLVATPVAAGRSSTDAHEVVVHVSSSPTSRPRRLIVAVLAVAATLLGLFVIARRDDAMPGTPASPATTSEIPAWYQLIEPALPARFTTVALTMVTEQQLWFVAISPSDGKTLEIQLSIGGDAIDATSVDATGGWTETEQGWSVQTPAGLLVDVRCDIGVRSTDPENRRNYCDLPSTGPFTKSDIRAVVTALATSLTPSIFDAAIGTAQPNTIDGARATALIAAAVPDQLLISDSDWGQRGSDHVYAYAADPNQSATSVRILHGVYPPPAATDQAAWALYDDAAAFWVFGDGGVAVRISTTNPLPESLTRLERLAHDIVDLDAVNDPQPESTAADVATTTAPATDATATTFPTVSTPQNSARNTAWEDAIDRVVAETGLVLAGTEYAPADVNPFTGSASANVGSGRIEFAVRAFDVGEYEDDPSWQRKVAGSSLPGVSVPEGTLFLDDEPDTSVRTAIIVAASGVITVSAEEVAAADLPPLETFEDAARALAAALPTVLAAT